jgi:hypothetical protein
MQSFFIIIFTIASFPNGIFQVNKFQDDFKITYQKLILGRTMAGAIKYFHCCAKYNFKLN